MGSTQTVSVVFTDLVGSTGLASTIGPARWAPLLRRHIDDLGAAVAQHGGALVKSEGDGVMAVFHSTRGAVSCAVAMQQGVDLQNRDAEIRLGMRVGVAVGEAEPHEGDWYGRPAIEAKRLCDLAGEGHVLVTDAVRLIATSPDGPTMESLGPVALKGFPDPFVTWRVLWEPLAADTRRPRLSRLVSALTTGVFVGRTDEQRRLNGAWTRATEGERGLVLISGDPGIGKTTLAGVLARQAHLGGAFVLYGRSARDVGLPYEPWRQVFAQLVASAPEHVLEAHFERHGDALAPLAPALSDHVDGRRLAVATDPETERYVVFAAALGLLAEGASEWPVLLVLDDVHWAGRPTLALLHHLELAAPAMRLLVVVTYRSREQSAPLTEILETLQRRPGVERIALEGLSQGEVEQLLSAAGAEAPGGATAAMAQELHEWTQGNPFFLAETVRHLQEVQPSLDASTGLDRVGLPTSVVEVIRGRVARLGDDAADLLRCGAVIGREFDLDVLIRVADAGAPSIEAEERALDALDAAVRAAVIVEHSERDGRYSFIHPLVVRALESELSGLRRARMHERIAGVLEARLADDPLASVGDVAHHWTMALGARPSSAAGTPVHAKTLESALRAGRAALGQLAPDEALRWFATASDLADGAPGHDELRREVLLCVGEAQAHAGKPEFRETLLHAAEVAQTAGDGDRLVRAALLNNRGMFSSSGAVDEERVEVLEAALGHAGRDDSRRARLLALLAAELLWSGDYDRRRELSDEAVELARRVNDSSALAYVLIMRVTSIWNAGNLAERLDITAESVRLADAAGDLHQRFWARVWRTTTLTQAGDLGEADRCLAELCDIAHRVQQPRLRFVSAAQEAWRAALGGRLADAERLADSALAIGQDAGEPDALTLYAAQLLPIRWHQGRLADEADLAAFIAESAPSVSVFAALAAIAAFEAGNREEAERGLAAMSGRAFSEIPADPVTLESLTLWGEVAAHLRDERAAWLLVPRLEHARDQVLTEGLGAYGIVSRCLGSLAGVLGRPDEADVHFAHALATHERLGADSLVARTCIDWGVMLCDAGRMVQGRHQLHTGMELAARLDLPGLEHRAREAAQRLETDSARGPAG